MNNISVEVITDQCILRCEFNTCKCNIMSVNVISLGIRIINLIYVSSVHRDVARVGWPNVMVFKINWTGNIKKSLDRLIEMNQSRARIVGQSDSSSGPVVLRA